MRQRYVWDTNAHDWIPIERYKAKAPHRKSDLVMSDIQPYRSIITGEQIGGRRQHRDHLRAHGCIEVGNEKLGTKPRAHEVPPVRQDIEQAVRPFINRYGVN